MFKRISACAFIITFLASCQNTNKVSEKDCYYSDYYQSKPPLNDNEYYQSNLKR